MLSLTFIIVFVICFALAVTSILIGHQLISTYNATFHRNYFYYLIAFYAFSIYSIWGQIAMRLLLSSIETTKEVDWIVTNFIPVLGIPFLLISWIMLVKMAYALVEVSSKNGTTRIHLLLFTVILPVVWVFYSAHQETWFMGEPFVFSIIAFILGIELAYMTVFAGIVFRYIKKVRAPMRNIVVQFVILLIIGLVLRGVALAFYTVGSWVLAPLILIYFASNLAALLYIRGHSDTLFMPIAAELPNVDKKLRLFEKYQITKREQEIIDELCLGKTNQQIADTLFISLQTVKDHTHRIYSKIGVNSRMKLVSLVNG